MNKDAQHGAAAICARLLNHDHSLYNRFLSQLPPNQRKALTEYLMMHVEAAIAARGLASPPEQD